MTDFVIIPVFCKGKVFFSLLFIEETGYINKSSHCVSILNVSTQGFNAQLFCP